MHTVSKEEQQLMVQMSQQISQSSQSRVRLEQRVLYQFIHQRQVFKLLERLRNKEPLRHQYDLICSLIQSALQNTCSIHTHEQVITLALTVVQQQDQYSVCESEPLETAIVDYIGQVIRLRTKTEYLSKCIGNLISLIFLGRQIFELPLIEITSLDLVLPQRHAALTKFSDKPMMLGLAEKAAKLTHLQEELSQERDIEFQTLSLELTATFMTCPHVEIDIDNIKCFKLLPPIEQLHALLKTNLTDDKLDQIHQLIHNNPDLNTVEMLPQLFQLILSANTSQAKTILVLKKFSDGHRIPLCYKQLRPIVIHSEKPKLVLITEICKIIASNQKEIVKIELDSKETQHLNLLYFILQLISADHFNSLYQQLLKRQITKFELVCLHVLIWTSDLRFDTQKLQMCCENFEMSDGYLAQLFSLYSFVDLSVKRKIKMLNGLQNLIREDFSMLDVCGVLGQNTTVPKNHSLKMLNQHYDTISHYLQGNNKLLQGFFSILLFFTDPQESEFIALFETLQDAMRAANRTVNMDKLLTAILQFKKKGNTQTLLSLYIMLLKHNYVLNDPSVRNQEEISEHSNEFVENEEKEKALRQEVVQESLQLHQKLEQKIKLLEFQQINQHTQEQHAMQALEIYRLMQVTSPKEITHKLLIKLPEYTFEDAKNLWKGLKEYQLVPVATVIIQLFKNQPELVILKMISVELNKFAPHGWLGLLYRNYDLQYLNTNQTYKYSQIELASLNVRKYQLLLSLGDGFEMLRIVARGCSVYEQACILMAICKHCSLCNTFLKQVGYTEENNFSGLIKRLCLFGVVEVVLLLLKQAPRKRCKDLKEVLDQPDRLIQVLLCQMQIPKNINEELLLLAEQIYKEGTQLELIKELFPLQAPPELPFLCLNSITDDIDKKLTHLGVLPLDPQLFQLAYQKIIQSEVISHVVINFAFQMINQIRMHDNIQTPKVDLNTLKDILHPNVNVNSGCTQQNQQQQFFMCKNCPLFGKTVEICASCAFNCHKDKDHDCEYDGPCSGFCDCGENPRKCTQIKKKQQYQRGSRQATLIELLQEKEQNIREIRDFKRHMLDHRQMLDMNLLEPRYLNWGDDLSDKDIVESVSSGDKEDSVIQEEESHVKVHENVLGESAFMKSLDIDMDALVDRLISFIDWAGSRGSLVIEEEASEFELKTPVIGTNQQFGGAKHLLKNNETFDIFNELKRHAENLQVRLQLMQLPFQIRCVIDAADQIVAIAVSGQEIRLYQKSKLQAHLDKKIQTSPPCQKISSKYAIASIRFNPWNSKQLLIQGLDHMHLVEIKDFKVESERSIVGRSQQMISKVIWVSYNQIAYLAYNQIVILNIDKQKEVQYILDDRIKDFVVYNDIVLAFDFQGDIHYQKMVDNGKIQFTQILLVNDELKGRNKFAFCISVIASMLLISYKGGASILCTLNGNQLNNIVRLDEIVDSDTLICAPQLIEQSKSCISFIALATKQNTQSQQYCFHRGKVLLFELINKVLKVSVINEQIVDNYVVCDSLLIAIQENKQLFLATTPKTQKNNLKHEEDDSSESQILVSLQDSLTQNVLDQCQSLPAQQGFCLSPNQLAGITQAQVVGSNITITPGNMITGIVFQRSITDHVTVLGRMHQRRENGNINVPLTILESIYTMIHRTLEFTPVDCQQVHVYVNKPANKNILLQVQSALFTEQKQYVFMSAASRQARLRPLADESNLTLLNALDTMGITLLSRPHKVPQQLADKLIALIKSNQKLITQSATKLLKIILKDNDMLGDEYHYKTIMDALFMDKALSNELVIDKLCKMQQKRQPQLYYYFWKNPRLVFELLTEQCHFQKYCLIFIHFLNYELNCASELGSYLKQLDNIKQQWSLSLQNRFDQQMRSELQKWKTGSQDFVFAWDILEIKQEEWDYHKKENKLQRINSIRINYYQILPSFVHHHEHILHNTNDVQQIIMHSSQLLALSPDVAALIDLKSHSQLKLIIMLNILNNHHDSSIFNKHHPGALSQIHDLLEQLLQKIQPMKEKISSERLRQYLKELVKDSEAHSQNFKYFERTEELLYLETVRYLYNITESNQQTKEQFMIQKNSWCKLLCQAQMNPCSKDFTSQYIKKLLQILVQGHEYHVVKDYNLYHCRFEELRQPIKYYSDEVRVFNAINAIKTAAFKRCEIFKDFCNENPVSPLLKQHMSLVLEVIELLI